MARKDFLDIAAKVAGKLEASHQATPKIVME